MARSAKGRKGSASKTPPVGKRKTKKTEKAASAELEQQVAAAKKALAAHKVKQKEHAAAKTDSADGVKTKKRKNLPAEGPVHDKKKKKAASKAGADEEDLLHSDDSEALPDRTESGRASFVDQVTEGSKGSFGSKAPVSAAKKVAAEKAKDKVAEASPKTPPRERNNAGAIILHSGGTSAEDIIDTRIKLAVAEAQVEFLKKHNRQYTVSPTKMLRGSYKGKGRSRKKKKDKSPYGRFVASNPSWKKSLRKLAKKMVQGNKAFSVMWTDGGSVPRKAFAEMFKVKKKEMKQFKAAWRAWMRALFSEYVRNNRGKVSEHCRKAAVRLFPHVVLFAENSGEEEGAREERRIVNNASRADYLQPLRLDPERPGDEFGSEKFRLMIAAGQRMNSREQKGGLPVTVKDADDATEERVAFMLVAASCGLQNLPMPKREDSGRAQVADAVKAVQEMREKMRRGKIVSALTFKSLKTGPIEQEKGSESESVSLESDASPSASESEEEAGSSNSNSDSDGSSSESEDESDSE